jgi:hypothetical protein
VRKGARWGGTRVAQCSAAAIRFRKGLEIARQRREEEKGGRARREEEKNRGMKDRIAWRGMEVGRKALGSHLVRGSDKISLAVSNSDWHLQVEEPTIDVVEVGAACESDQIIGQ